LGAKEKIYFLQGKNIYRLLFNHQKVLYFIKELTNVFLMSNKKAKKRKRNASREYNQAEQAPPRITVHQRIHTKDAWICIQDTSLTR